MNKRLILALSLSICTLLPALGQTKPQTPQPPPDDNADIVRITTNLVQVDAVVTKDGKVVPNLTANDFEIYEDGKRQTITSFAFISNVSSSPAPAPAKEDKKEDKRTSIVVPAGPIKRDVPRRTMAIVVDDMGLSFESMNQVRRQVRKFIAEQMQPNDLIAVIRTGSEMGTLQQFTNDKRLLNRAVDQLRWNARSRAGITVLPQFTGPDGISSLPSGYSFGSYSNSLGKLRFIIEAMGRLPGRKSLIIMSDSMPIEDQETLSLMTSAAPASLGDTMSSDSSSDSPSFGDTLRYGAMLNKIAEQAIRASVVIYSIDTQSLQPIGPTAADRFTGNPRQVQEQMNNLLTTRSRLLQTRREGGDLIARQTGGFQIRNSNDFRFDRILEDQSGYYLLGYRPTEQTFNRRFHHIKAKVKRSGLSVRTRNGFYGFSEEEVKRSRPTPQDTTNLALISPFGAQDLELEITSFFANDKTEGSMVRSFVYVDPANLTFTPVNDRQELSLEIYGIIFGDNGKIAEQVKHTVSMSLLKDEYEQAKREGLRVRFDLPAKRPGSYQVRIAVKDKASEKVGSAGQFVAVPDLRNKALALSGIVLRGAAETSSQKPILTTPAIRRFRANSSLYFAFVIYNAQIDPATQLPNLTMQTRLFRDGKSIGPAAEVPLDARQQPDLSRIFISALTRLGPELEPGDYYLQVVINDKLAKTKQPPVVQWVDFQIVK